MMRQESLDFRASYARCRVTGLTSTGRSRALARDRASGVGSGRLVPIFVGPRFIQVPTPTFWPGSGDGRSSRLKLGSCDTGRFIEKAEG